MIPPTLDRIGSECCSAIGWSIEVNPIEHISTGEKVMIEIAIEALYFNADIPKQVRCLFRVG